MKRDAIIALVIGVAFMMPIEWMGLWKSLVCTLIISAAAFYLLVGTEKNRAKP